MIVAGELLLIDPASGEARTVDTHGVDVSWTAWRDDERLFAIGVRGLEPVALDVRRRRRDCRGDLGRIRLLRRELLPVRIADRPGQGVRGRAGGLGSPANRGTRRRRLGADAGRPRPRRDDCPPRAHRRPAPRALERSRRARDRRLPDAAARRGAVPDDPARPRRPDLDVPGHARRTRSPSRCSSAATRSSTPTCADRPAAAANSRRSWSATWAAATSATCSRASTTSSPKGSQTPTGSASWASSYGGLHGELAADPGRALQGRGRNLPGHQLVQRALRQQPRRVGGRLPGRRAEARRAASTTTAARCCSRAPTARPRC